MIHPADDGHLECDMHAGEGYKNWCDHIKHFVANNQDVDLIHPVDDNKLIQVPMLPDLKLFQEVDLAAISTLTGSRPCLIEFEHKGSYYDAGHLMPGEGRRVIRENLIQWMIARPGSTGDECKASLHGWAEGDRLRRMDGMPKALIERWCMFTTDMCTVCYKKFLAISDVIPTGP